FSRQHRSHLIPSDELAPLLQLFVDPHGFELQRVDSRLGPGHDEGLPCPGANALTPITARGTPLEGLDELFLPPKLLFRLLFSSWRPLKSCRGA
ncbi:hypothetical protein GOODEAATRI_028133, partial [Goodea atripinnis]